jgi:hypothetical protein
VRDVFERFGFTLLSDDEGVTAWEYDIEERGVITSEFIGIWDEHVVNA